MVSPIHTEYTLNKKGFRGVVCIFFFVRRGKGRLIVLTIDTPHLTSPHSGEEPQRGKYTVLPLGKGELEGVDSS
jgi:hypothetical protein